MSKKLQETMDSYRYARTTVLLRFGSWDKAIWEAHFVGDAADLGLNKFEEEVILAEYQKWPDHEKKRIMLKARYHRNKEKRTNQHIHFTASDVAKWRKNATMHE